jgi:hypothetical protein
MVQKLISEEVIAWGSTSKAAVVSKYFGASSKKQADRQPDLRGGHRVGYLGYVAPTLR